MNNRVFYLLVAAASMAALTCCEDPADNPLVGLWEEAVNLSNQNDPRYSRNCYPEGPDIGFDGTWLFENDGNYQLDFAFGSIAGSRHGLSYGTYDLISDSILLLDVTYYEYQDSVYNVDSLFSEVKDSHYVAITEDRLIDHHAICNVYWRRIK